MYQKAVQTISCLRDLLSNCGVQHQPTYPAEPESADENRSVECGYGLIVNKHVISF